ncbi:ATP-binding protein [Roseiarcaceae bacterium H3SJ34-1]|uniref:ATP-binding protein n=1 Tax=Terripilifer ovatus TaxID=3032367 RepID=UPI003AB91E84|nr:ATP-binding protein [Roseiarcaceae bacterium H3SJ34-1]
MKRMLATIMPDTVVTRAVTVLVVALLVLNAIGYLTYRVGVDAIVSAARERELAERISSITEAIRVLPSAAERDRAAHALATPTLEVHWAQSAPVTDSVSLDEDVRLLIERLRVSLKLDATALVAGYTKYGTTPQGGDKSHILQVSVRLDDKSWLWFLSHASGTLPHLSWSSLLIPMFMCASIILIAVLSLRWVTRPLRLFAKAAEEFSLDAKSEKLTETGPKELRAAARALNTMLERIGLLVRERTQALAALSHDLRTPITRIQLRNELTDDTATRSATEADLAEMDSMVQSTLDYLRSGGTQTEAVQMVDIVSILHTICDDLADLAHDVELTAPSSALLQAGPVSIKRALSNVIGNACKYGERVRVVVAANRSIKIIVNDDGPGIPPEELSHVFEPFYRVEASRSRTTGGSGLGLTIARNIVVAHQGSIEIENRPAGGLQVRITLPRPPPTTRPTRNKL